MSIATQPAPAAASNSLAPVKQPKEKLIVHDDGPLAHLMDTARFEHLYRIATIMASAGVLPLHLAGIKKGQNFTPFTKEEIIGTCFQIVNQAFRWGIDPFAVKDETYVVAGKLGYQGKLVAAVINSRAGMSSRLRYEFKGTGDNLTVTVYGQFEGESEPRTIELSVGQAKTDNDMWRRDPQQKLVYSGATKWARRHAPEVMLGVLTDDDIERMAETRQREEAATLAGRPPRTLGALQQSWQGETSGVGESVDASSRPATDDSDGLAPGETVNAATGEVSGPTETVSGDLTLDREAGDEPAVTMSTEHPLYQLAIELAACTVKPEVTAIHRRWCGERSDLPPDLLDEARGMCNERTGQLPLTLSGKSKQKELG